MFGRLLCAMAVASLSWAAVSEVRVVEEIVAKVNGDIITRSELERAQQQIAAELHQQGLTGVKLQQEVKEKAADALRDRIDQLLLVQKAKDLNLSVDSDVTKRM